MDRRAFLARGMALGTGLALGSLHAFGSRMAGAGSRPVVQGYGALVAKGDLMLPPAFHYEILSVQGRPQSDGTLTPGMFDGMAAYPGPDGTTVLIRNHENRRLPGEIPAVVPAGLRYDDDPSYVAGCSRLVVKESPGGPNRRYAVVESFNLLGGTDANCAGGALPPLTWITCEEAVSRGATGRKHGYAFEVDGSSGGPELARPIVAAGRFVHEATAWHAGVLYQTEDRGLDLGGSCFYRYVASRANRSRDLAGTTGVLQALKLKDQFNANMDLGRLPGVPYACEWVTIDDPDHDDDTDLRIDRVPGFTPLRYQAQDKGAAIFDRQEGMWVGRGRIFFDCTTGGALDLGQVWEYDPAREAITLVYESDSALSLKHPDNVVIVPWTGDVLLQEDGYGEQFIRGLTPEGEIYDFARSLTNQTEFCGGCFDPGGGTLYVNQQGSRGELPFGPSGARAVTYAIHGPFHAREGIRVRGHGSGPV